MQKRVSFYSLFFAFFLLSLFLILLSFGPRFGVVRGFFEILLHPFQKTSYALLVPEDSSELARLKEQNATLSTQLAKMQELSRENVALHDQFQVSSVPAANLLPAPILAMPGFVPGLSAPERLIISAGTHDHVAMNMPVIVRDVLLGKTTSPTVFSSQVVLLTNTASSVTAVDAKTNALGIVKGQGNGGMNLENVVLADSLHTGDMIVTKGDVNAGTGYPPGLIIGKITAVHKHASSLFQSAEIEGIVDVTKLGMVFVKIE